jgi:hypothetical protein
VAENHARRVLLYPPEPDKALPFRNSLLAWNLESLRITVETRLLILSQHALPLPVPESRRRPGVDVLGRGIPIQPLTQDNSD